MNVIANGYELSRVNRNDTFTSQKRHRTISIIIQLLLITILFIWFIQKKKKNIYIRFYVWFTIKMIYFYSKYIFIII